MASLYQLRFRVLSQLGVAAMLVCCSTQVTLAFDSMHFDGSGRETPWTSCTTCHGSDLLGAGGPACNTCHQDFAEPDLPPTGHHFPGRDDPIANNCTACHGADLTGGGGPSCYDCHGELWGGGNSPPVVDPGGPYSGVVGVAIEFDGSGTTDADGDLLVYLWVFGDGSETFPSQMPTTSHVYEAAGTYTAFLTVTDGVNFPVMEEFEVVITEDNLNLPPVVDPGDSYSGIAGQPLQLDGSGTVDPDGDPLEFLWDFGDGNQSSTSSSPLVSHTYSAAGAYTATLTVSDGVNDPVSEQVAVDIAPPNTPPVADPGGPYSGTVGEAVEFDGSGSSDADGDTLTFLWDFGDGSTPSAEAVASHTYSSAGNYTATLTVSDGVNFPVSSQVSVQISSDSNPPEPGNGWVVRLPFVGAEGTIEFEEFAGFLFVTEEFNDRSIQGLGLRYAPLIFWMDSKGALFIGNENATTMVGMVYKFMGTSDTVWFAESMSEGEGESSDLLGGLMSFF